MIPTHVLDDLTLDQSVAILSQGGEIRFLVHPTTTDLETIRASAAREGSEVLTTHMRDHTAIREYVASLERDTGGEG